MAEAVVPLNWSCDQPSRRALLAGLAASPAVILIVSAPRCRPGDDRLLEAHRAARVEFMADSVAGQGVSTNILVPEGRTA